MHARHILLALSVVAIWGFNFVVIQVGLREFPPILMTALRFVLVVVPAVFLLPRPRVPVRLLILYGLFMFTLQFAFLFGGMYLGVPAGLASLVLQFQVLVTVVLSVLVLGEAIRPYKVAGILIALAGLGIVAWNTGGTGAIVGFVLVICGAISWGIANLVSKRIGPVNALSLVVWGGLVPPVPLLAVSLAVEGPARIATALSDVSWIGVGAIAYIVYPTTFYGFSVWSKLLNTYPASTVAPFALLVPVFGMAFAATVLGEPMQGWKLIASALVLIGVGINVLGPTIIRRRSRPRETP